MHYTQHRTADLDLYRNSSERGVEWYDKMIRIVLCTDDSTAFFQKIYHCRSPVFLDIEVRLSLCPVTDHTDHELYPTLTSWSR